MFISNDDRSQAGDGMMKHLTIGETAKRLGLEVDTVRKLERAGRIRAVRTSGGHRRFTEEEVERFRKSRSKSGRAKSAPPRRRSRASNRAIPNRNPSTGEFVGEDVVFADDSEDFDEELSVDELEEAELTSYRPAPPPPIRYTPPPQKPLPRPGESDALFALRALTPLPDPGLADRLRLQNIKGLGRAAIPWNTPAEWQGKVIAELERFVTTTQFPADLSLYKAAEIVRARVETVLRPWREAEEQAKRAKEAQEAAERHRKSLIAHGNEYARPGNHRLGLSAKWDAREEVGKVLTRDVEPDWTEDDVEDLVDEVLDEWDDDEDEDEAED